MDDMFAHDPNARPAGITFIALLMDLTGLISIGVAILGLIGFTSPQPKTVATYPNIPLAVTFLIIHGLLGVGYMIVASGLWRLQRWAFWAAIAGSILLVVNYALDLWGHVLSSPITVGGLVLPLLVLLYFALSPSARKAFGV